MAGFISADRIEAGTISTAKITSDFGQSLMLSSSQYIQLSATDFDSLGNPNSGIYLAPTSVKINSGGTFELHATNLDVSTDGTVAARNLSLNGGSITLKDGNTTKFSVTNTGYLTSVSGSIGGWTIGDTTLTGNNTGLAKTTNDTDIAIWAGNATAGSAAFRVQQNGYLYASNVNVTGTIHASTLYIGNTQANISLDSSGKVTLGSLASVNLSSYTFDSLGNSSGSGIYLTPTLIQAKSTGTVDFSAANEIKLKAGSISMAAISDYTPPDLSNYYSKASGVTISGNGVDISGSKHINLDIDTNNYVHINNNGIEMKGKKIKFIDSSGTSYNAFTQDVIAVLANGQTEAQISHPAHNWVLIKPFYDASITYSYNTAYEVRAASSTVQLTTTGTHAFGSASEWYQYDISATVTVPSGQTQGTARLVVYLANTSGGITQSVAMEGTVETYQQATTFTCSTGHISTNLCSEGASLFLRVDTKNYVRSLTNITVTCTTSATTSKVPCTVYYYP